MRLSIFSSPLATSMIGSHMFMNTNIVSLLEVHLPHSS